MEDLDDLLHGDASTIYFGPAWSIHLHGHAYRVPTPLGERCHICGETIINNDRGYLSAIPVLNEDGWPSGHIIYIHIECSTYYLIGHDVGVCECNGYQDSRQSALLAWKRANLGTFHH